MPIEVKKSTEGLSFAGASIKTLQLLFDKGYLTTRQFAGLKAKELDDQEEIEIIKANIADPQFVAILGEFISLAEFTNLCDSHKASRRTDIPDLSRPGQMITDTNSCWFELSEIDDFLKKNNLDLASPKGKGVRIHFGRHLFYDKKHPLYATAILVATTDNGRTNPSGDPIQDDDLRYISVGGGPYNHGTLCPPDSICP